MKGPEYREVWVSEDNDGRPLRSAINERRLNDQTDVFRYVPADCVAGALEYLEVGNTKDALRVLRRLLKKETK